MALSPTHEVAHGVVFKKTALRVKLSCAKRAQYIFTFSFCLAFVTSAQPNFVLSYSNACPSSFFFILEVITLAHILLFFRQVLYGLLHIYRASVCF
jgi:hypothetical protein